MMHRNVSESNTIKRNFLRSPRDFWKKQSSIMMNVETTCKKQEFQLINQPTMKHQTYLTPTSCLKSRIQSNWKVPSNEIFIYSIIIY